MISEVLEEFIAAGVLTTENYDALWNTFSPEDITAFSTLGSNILVYSEVVAYVTLQMLKHNLATYTESSPIRQALSDLFVAHPLEYIKLMGGDQKLAGFFMGRAMKVNKAFNPKDIQKRIAEMVAEEKEVYEWQK